MSKTKPLTLPNETEPQLGFPAWGPFGKDYVGLSHVADRQAGHRWDFYLLPSFHRRAVVGPYALREESWHVWSAKPDLSSYQLRYELEWKDQVYVDLTVQEIGPNSRKLVASCVNRTDLPQSLDLHFAASLAPNPVSGTRPELPEHAVWIPAVDYQEIKMPGQQHRRHQVADGLRPGETLHALAVQGSGLGVQFFHTPGDTVAYEFEVKEEMKNPRLVLRYHRWSEETLRVRLSGCVETELDMDDRGDGMEQRVVELAPLNAGKHSLRLEVLQGGGMVFDGFVLVEQSQLGKVRFVSRAPETRPDAEWQEDERVLSLAYPGVDSRYQIQFPASVDWRRRTVTGNDVPAILSARANDRVHLHQIGLGDAHTEVVALGPISLEPQSAQCLEVQVSLGGTSLSQQELAVKNGHAQGSIDYTTPYRQGMEILAANTIGNVVYPVRHQHRWIQHYTPGRAWDCLYTWDSGMLGVGLTVFSPQRATESLNQYLLPVGNSDAAYLEHGTPLPIQAYQALEIWNRTHDRAFLAWVFPRLRQFYEFMAGRSHGSSTDRLGSGLLQTWDYNYNSGGWDDYPPQHALIEDPARRGQIAPAVTTSHAIRFAKILLQFASELGDEVADGAYSQDVKRWTAALEEKAWDEETGYYAYLEHDEKGNPIGFYRHDSGENYNRGLDGVSPLVTGEMDEAHVSRMLQNLFNTEELWTEIGFSTVSLSAAYYDDAGYWNGAMWIPHQWLFWKALLDLGRGDLAARLAEALLKCWEREAAASYHSFELFRIKTGRGSGWHQFSGLSAPLLAIHAAYYEPGVFTTGYDTWVRKSEWNESGEEFRAELKVQSNGPATVLLVPKQKGSQSATATWQGEKIDVKASLGAACQLRLEPGQGELRFWH